jgi:hypothetical protein
MNSIRRRLAGRERARGQSIYMVLLIIACVSLAVAVFFPTFEYIALYRGEPHPYKSDLSASVKAAAARRPKPAPAPAAPAAEPGPAADTGAVTAPEPVDEPAPASTNEPSSSNGLTGGVRMAKQSSWRGPVRGQ